MDRSVQVNNAQFAKAIKEPHPHLKFTRDTKDITKWYVLATGIIGHECAFEGGEYLIEVNIPSSFPKDPPHFYFLTPNGLYGVGTKVCVSIGQYHANDYRPVLGIIGFCANLISGMIGWNEMTPGIAILKTTVREKRELAKKSAAANRRDHGAIIDQINDEYAEYSKKWKK